MSGTTWVSRYQKGITRKVKTSLDLLEQEIVSGIPVSVKFRAYFFDAKVKNHHQKMSSMEK